MKKKVVILMVLILAMTVGASAYADTTAPENLTLTRTSSEVVLNWDDVSGVQFYIIYRSTTPNEIGQLMAYSDHPTYTDETVSDYSTYYYSVSSMINGTESNSSRIESQPVVQMPVAVAPENLTVSRTSSEAFLSWDEVYGAQFYVVYRSTLPGEQGQQVAYCDDPTYIDTTVEESLNYYYSVSSMVNGEESATSTVGPSLKDLFRPKNLRVSRTSSEAVLSWDDIYDAQFYVVYRSTTPNELGQLVAYCDSATYVDENVQDYTTYYYSVSSMFNGTESNMSKLESLPVVEAPVAVAPENLVATRTSSEVVLDWNAVYGAQFYVVYRSSIPGEQGQQVAYCDDPAYVDYSVQDYTTYYYSVSSMVNGTESTTARVESSSL